jgi:hypothetical protein
MKDYSVVYVVHANNSFSLPSFLLQISSDHCSLTHSLVQKSLQLSANFVGFHTDYIELVSCQGGNRDEKNQLAELAQKLAVLESVVEQWVIFFLLIFAIWLISPVV